MRPKITIPIGAKNVINVERIETPTENSIRPTKVSNEIPNTKLPNNLRMTAPYI